MTTKVPVELSSTPGIVDGSNATAITIDSSENVGIGITSSLEKFTVSNSSSGIVGRFTNNTNQTLDLGITAGSGSAGGVYYNNANSGYHAFQVGGTEKIRLTSAGHLSVGATSITNGGGYNKVIQVSGSEGCFSAISGSNEGLFAQNGVNTQIVNRADGYMQFRTNNVERFRIKNTGNQSQYGGQDIDNNFFADSGSSQGSVNFRFLTDGSSANDFCAFITMQQGSGDGAAQKGEILFGVSDNGNPATALSIANNKLVTTSEKLLANGGVYISAFDGDKLITDGSQGGGSDALFIGNAQIQVSSDERIKKDVVDTAINATEKLKEVRVVDFTWDDPKDQSYNNKNARGQWTGAIAQELISVFPHIINAPRDKETLEVDNDSERKWLVEYENLVPILIKSIQELSAKNDALEARIKTLEDA